ncbi:dockerin type I domain-containing protein [Paenibacillus enshidis]|uniref:Dockerin type I domain-containing protein n=1 Tax=Paenibacillus enshidis TaxID=1458439 RepID=A0ABV5AWS4_9BACL
MPKGVYCFQIPERRMKRIMLKKAGRFTLYLALISIVLNSFLSPKIEVQADNSTASLQYKYKPLRGGFGTAMKLYYNDGTFYYKSQLFGRNLAHQSTDLKTWTKIISPDTFGSSTTFDLHSLSFIGGRVYATGYTQTGDMLNYTNSSFLGYMNNTSNSSSSWTRSSFPTGNLLLGPIATDGSHYVIGVGNDNVIYQQSSSSNGIEEKVWTSSRNITNGSRFENAVYDGVNKRFILADDEGNVVYSTDGGNAWKKLVLDSASAISDLVQVGGTTYISGGDGVWKLKGTTVTRLLPSGSNYRAVAVDENNNVYSLRMDGTVLMSSDDGATWSTLVVADSENTSTYFGAMEYGNGKLLVGGNNGLYEVVVSTPEVKVSYVSGDHGTISVDSEMVEVGGFPTAVPNVTPDSGYHFTGWSSDGGVTLLSSEKLRATVVMEATTYTAYYSQIVKGDINGKDGVSPADALLLKKYLRGEDIGFEFGPAELEAADVNSDGVVNEADVQAILAMFTGKG